MSFLEYTFCSLKSRELFEKLKMSKSVEDMYDLHLVRVPISHCWRKHNLSPLKVKR